MFAILVSVSSGLFYKILCLCVCYFEVLCFLCHEAKQDMSFACFRLVDQRTGLAWAFSPSMCRNRFTWILDITNWVVVSNIFYFHPYLGKWSNLTNIFQMGWNHQLAKLDNAFLHSVRIDMWSHIARPGPRIRQVGQSFPGDRRDKKEGNERWWIQMNHAFHNKIWDRWSYISNFIWSYMFIGLLEYGTFYYDDDTVEHV